MTTEYNTYYHQSYALIVGINRYAHPGFTPLGDAESDAKAMAEVLQEPPYEFQVKRLLGEEATKSNILNALYTLRGGHPDDRVLIYFAGHGYTLYDRFNHPTGYLAAYDTEPDRDFTALRVQEITDLTRHAQAKHISFIFDSCYSATALGLVAPRSNLAAERYLTSRVYQALTAGEEVVDDTRSMTELIVESLRNYEADPDTGLFTLSTLGQEVRDRMVMQTRSIQIPQFGYLPGSQGGDYILVMDSRPRLPADLMAALYSDYASVRRGALNELVSYIRQEDDYARAALIWMHDLAENDADARVRSTAKRFLEETHPAGITLPDMSVRDVLTKPKPKPQEPVQPISASSSPLPYTLMIAGGGAVAGILALMLGVFLVSQVVIPSLRPTPTPTATQEPTSPGSATDEPTPTLPLDANRTPIQLTPTFSIIEQAQRGVTSNTAWAPVGRNVGNFPMVLVPAGCFTMGTTEQAAERATEICDAAIAQTGSTCGVDFFLAETPPHEVCFDEPFWINEREVTNAQYAEFLNRAGNLETNGVPWFDEDTNENRIFLGEGGTWQVDEGYADHPAIGMTWYGAAAYCQARDSRLPTEAEWEYAARGPDSLEYPWGEFFRGDRLNYCDFNCSSVWRDQNFDDGFTTTAPVESFPLGASWVGALNMLGNVREWTSSAFVSYPYDANDGREALVDSDIRRVLRGGGWRNDLSGARTTVRERRTPDTTQSTFGFRCAMDFEPGDLP